MKTTLLLYLGLSFFPILSGCNKCNATAGGADCICYQIYAPVCGCDGKTYDNDCHAECAGVDYKEGECR